MLLAIFRAPLRGANAGVHPQKYPPQSLLVGALVTDYCIRGGRHRDNDDSHTSLARLCRTRPPARRHSTCHAHAPSPAMLPPNARGSTRRAPWTGCGLASASRSAEVGKRDTAASSTYDELLTSSTGREYRLYTRYATGYTRYGCSYSQSALRPGSEFMRSVRPWAWAP